MMPSGEIGIGRRPSDFLRDESGSVLPLVGLCMLVIFVLGAIVVDFGFQQAVRSQMRAAADAAALAAVVELPNKSRATSAALHYAELNMPESANGHVLFADDIEFGHWDYTHREFDSGGKPYDAVRLTLRRGGENGNAAPTFFLNFFGAREASLQVQSTAGMVVPYIEYLYDPSILSDGERKKVEEMIHDVQVENKERMWDKATKRYDDRKRMTKEEIEDFLFENYGQPALLK